MAKPVEPADNGGDEQEDQQTFTAIVKGKLKALLAKFSKRQADMDEARAEMGAMINNAVEKDNLHKGAFGWIKRLNKMDAVKRNEWLFHFDVMREHMGWEQSDLLADRQPQEAEQKKPARPPFAEHRRPERVGAENDSAPAQQ